MPVLSRQPTTQPAQLAGQLVSWRQAQFSPAILPSSAYVHSSVRFSAKNCTWHSSAKGLAHKVEILLNTVDKHNRFLLVSLENANVLVIPNKEKDTAQGAAEW